VGEASAQGQKVGGGLEKWIGECVYWGKASFRTRQESGTASSRKGQESGAKDFKTDQQKKKKKKKKGLFIRMFFSSFIFHA
jgi:hypothetical protein